MPLEEGRTAWRYRFQSGEKFDRIRVVDVDKRVPGVKATLGRVRGSNRWEIESYIFEKTQFRSAEQVRTWIQAHVKKESRSLLDYEAFNEQRRRLIRAYVENSLLT
jgi:hypothetical protein